MKQQLLQKIRLNFQWIAILALASACELPDGTNAVGGSNGASNGDGQISSGGSSGGAGGQPSFNAPAMPVVTGTTPTTSGSTLSPTVNGTADASTIIEIFSDSTCSTSLGLALSDGSGNFTVPVSITRGTTSTLYAQASGAGGPSACSSTSASYHNTLIGVGRGLFSGTQTNAPSTQTNINQDTAYSIEWSTSEFDSTYFSHSTSSNSEQITILTAGDYFVSVTIPMASGVQRSSVRAEVYVNGSEYRGSVMESSYIRNGSNHGESSNHLAMLIEGLVASDVVDVRVVRNAAAGTTTIMEQATTYLEYVSTSRTVFTGVASQVTAGTNLNQATASGLIWTSSRKDTGFSHDNVTNPEQVTLDASGDYMVYVNLPTYSTVQRPSVHIQVKLDGVVVASGTAAQGYIRNSAGHNDSTVHWAGILPGVTAGAALTIETIEGSESGTVTISSGKVASLMVEMIDASSGVYSGRGSTLNNLTSATNWNPTTASEILWTTDDITDASSFTHSTTSNQHQITVPNQGDYMLVYNDIQTTALQRSNPRIRIAVNGTDITGAIAATHYVRNSSAHTTSSASMVFFLRNLAANAIITVTVQAESTTGTVNDSDDALVVLIRQQ